MSRYLLQIPLTVLLVNSYICCLLTVDSYSIVLVVYNHFHGEQLYFTAVIYIVYRIQSFAGIQLM